VFEEMREAGTAHGLVYRTDVIPEIDGDYRETMVLRKDYFKPVG
jgi:hypothetical protein